MKFIEASKICRKKTKPFTKEFGKCIKREVKK
jgi:hypothetical protein